MNPKTKVCSKCCKRKPIEKYGPLKHGKYGVRPECKSCACLCAARYRLANPEKTKQASRRSVAKWRKENRKQYLAYNANWQKANPEKMSASRRKWQKANPEILHRIFLRKKERLPPDLIANYMRLPVKLVPPELIEAKRIQLQIKRYLKNGHD